MARPVTARHLVMWLFIFAVAGVLWVGGITIGVQFARLIAGRAPTCPR